MKKIFVSVLLMMATVPALAAVREGNFNYRGQSFYSNGVGAYCQRHQYHYDFPELSYYDARELNYTRFDGMCAEGPAEGGMNYRGRSYYANAEGHYCQYRYYRNDLREVDGWEAQQLFRKIFDGTCRD